MTTEGTFQFRNKSLLSCNLPPEMENNLLLKYKDKKIETPFIGPVHSRYGKWYFKVENIKKGGVKIPFELVKSKILNDIQVQHFPIDSILKTENGQKLFDRKVFSSSLYDDIYSKVESTSDEEIKKSIMNRSVEISYKQGDTIKEGMLFEARMRLVESKANALLEKTNDWIRSLSINKELLNSK
jgi:hypothetical protein